MKIEPNNIYNANCIDVLDEMIRNGYQVQFILTDPPYGISYQSNHRTEKFDIIANDDFTDEKQVKLIYDYFERCYQVLENDKFLVSFMGWSTIPTFNDALTKAGFTIKSMPIWYKNVWGMGYYTRPQYEPMYLCMKGKPKPPQAAISDVIKADKVVDLIHSCQKPINLLSILINTFSQPDDIVFDGFGGSFSTCVAARKCGRQYISCEIDEKLFEIGKKNLGQEINQITLFDINF